MITKTSKMISVQLIRVINLIPWNHFFFLTESTCKNNLRVCVCGGGGGVFFFFFFFFFFLLFYEQIHDYTALSKIS